MGYSKVDVEAASVAYVRTRAALELAGRGIGPWYSYPDNGEPFWTTVPVIAAQHGEKGSWVKAIADHAAQIGALEMAMPLSSKPGTCLVLADICQAGFHNVLIKPDGSGVVVDLDQVDLGERTTADRTHQALLRSYQYDGDIRFASYSDALEETVKRHGAHLPEHSDATPSKNCVDASWIACGGQYACGIGRKGRRSSH